jgi:general secretion pathway protein I
MMAVFTQLNQYATTAIFIQQKTLASWIASNRLTELSIQNEWPELGNEADEVEYAGFLWGYEVEISATDVDNLRRADVSVFLQDNPDRVVHKVSALIEPPPPRGFAPLRWLTLEGDRG